MGRDHRPPFWNRFLGALVAAVILSTTNTQAGPKQRAADSLKPAGVPEPLCSYLITVADDFVVEVYLNGHPIPDQGRELILERFGATGEKVGLAVRSGDWLVFHLVCDRLRWNGSRYFAVAGCREKNQFGFVSDPASPDWSVCDRPDKVDAFIRERKAGAHHRAQAIAIPWGEGDTYMKEFAGDGYTGHALWGSAASTWIKYVAPAAASSKKKETRDF